jgi:hypothetical protein
MVLKDIITRVEYKVLKEDALKQFTGFHCSANQPECKLEFPFQHIRVQRCLQQDIPELKASGRSAAYNPIPHRL